VTKALLALAVMTSDIGDMMPYDLRCRRIRFISIPGNDVITKGTYGADVICGDDLNFPIMT
jgi:hypothetical protein